MSTPPVYPSAEQLREARRRGVLDRLPMFDRITLDGVAWNDGSRPPAADDRRRLTNADQ